MVLGLGLKGTTIFYSIGGITLWLYAYVKPTVDLFITGYVSNSIALQLISSVVQWVIVIHAVLLITKLVAPVN